MLKHLLIIASLIVLIQSSLSASKVKVEYYFFQPEVKYCGDEMYNVSMKGYNTFGKVGEPILPMKTARILIPPETKVKNVIVYTEGESIIPGSYFINYGKEARPMTEEPRDPGPNYDIYTSNNWFPGVFNSVGEHQYLRGAKIYIFNLYPVQYQPAKGILKFYTKFIVNVETTECGESKGTLRYRNKKSDDEIIMDFVDNPQMIAHYENMRREKVTEDDNYQYVIITKEDLVDAFEVLANWIESENGLTTNIVTTEYIDSLDYSREGYLPEDEADLLQQT